MRLLKPLLVEFLILAFTITIILIKSKREMYTAMERHAEKVKAQKPHKNSYPTTATSASEIAGDEKATYNPFDMNTDYGDEAASIASSASIAPPIDFDGGNLNEDALNGSIHDIADIKSAIILPQQEVEDEPIGIPQFEMVTPTEKQQDDSTPNSDNTDLPSVFDIIDTEGFEKANSMEKATEDEPSTNSIFSIFDKK